MSAEWSRPLAPLEPASDRPHRHLTSPPNRWFSVPRNGRTALEIRPPRRPVPREEQMNLYATASTSSPGLRTACEWRAWIGFSYSSPAAPAKRGRRLSPPSAPSSTSAGGQGRDQRLVAADNGAINRETRRRRVESVLPVLLSVPLRATSPARPPAISGARQAAGGWAPRRPLDRSAETSLGV